MIESYGRRDITCALLEGFCEAKGGADAWRPRRPSVSGAWKEGSENIFGAQNGEMFAMRS